MVRLPGGVARHHARPIRTSQNYASFVGAANRGQTGNNGRIFITLKPWAQRSGGSAQISSTVSGPSSQRSRAPTSICRPAQDIRVGGRLSRTQYEYTLQDADLSELYQWAPKVLDAAQVAADAARRRDRSADGGNHRDARRSIATAAARFGIQPQAIDDTLYDAFGQRQITQYFTQMNSYHLILEVPPTCRARSRRWTSSTSSPRPVRPCRSPPSSRSDTTAGPAALDQPPEPVPGGDALLQSGAGRGARRGGEGDPDGGGRNWHAGHSAPARSRARRRRSNRRSAASPI